MRTVLRTAMARATVAAACWSWRKGGELGHAGAALYVLVAGVRCVVVVIIGASVSAVLPTNCCWVYLVCWRLHVLARCRRRDRKNVDVAKC
jgi:hypothetical protein